MSGLNTSGPGLFGGTSITGGVNGITAYSGDPLKLALGGTLLIDTAIGMGGFYLSLTNGRLGIGMVPNAAHVLDVTGVVRQTSDLAMKMSSVTSGGVIGMELFTNTDVRRGFFTMNVNTGEIRIGGDTGGYRPRIVSNGIDALLFDNTGNVIVGTGVASSQLVIGGSGALAGVYSPAYNSVASNIIAYKDYTGNTRMTLDMSSTTKGDLIIAGTGSIAIGAAAATSRVTFPQSVLTTDGLDWGDVAIYRDAVLRLRITQSLFVVGTISSSAAADLGAGMFVGGGTLDASSLLAVNSTTKGFLAPRMTTVQKNAIVTPAAGLIVYDTNLNKLCVRVAAAWETITSA